MERQQETPNLYDHNYPFSWVNEVDDCVGAAEMAWKPQPQLQLLMWMGIHGSFAAAVVPLVFHCCDDWVTMSMDHTSMWSV